MTTTGALYRSNSDKVLCGVSGGLAEYFDVDPSLVRVGWIVVSCLTVGAAVLGYLFLCLVVPEEDVAAAEPSNIASTSPGGGNPSKVPNHELSEEVRILLQARQELGPEYEDELLDSFVERTEEALKSRRAKARNRTTRSRGPVSSRGILILLLLGAGAAYLLANFGSISPLTWAESWPLILIGAGAILLLRRRGN